MMMIMLPTVCLINGLVKGDWMEALLNASDLAVGLVPVMLPMLVTINMAKGGRAMSRKKMIVKRLSAIQNFGTMNILSVDKAVTPTQDKVILERYINITGHDDGHVLALAYLNSHYQSRLKNLLDVAVLEHADIHQKLHAANV